MELLLEALLNSLEEIGSNHSELYDTMVRECIATALYRGVVLQVPNFQLRDSFGLYSDEANLKVKEALEAFITGAHSDANAMNVDEEAERVKLVWNYEIQSTNGRRADDFFGAI